MPPPNDTKDLPDGAYLVPHSDGRLEPSSALVHLFVAARSNYDWPKGTGANKSQQTIIDLENIVAKHIAALTADNARAICCDVSFWAGNNDKAHAAICNATMPQKEAMQRAILDLVDTGKEAKGLDILCNLPGISLVIASKIYRFCVPQTGAAVDRHASHFFNSLLIKNADKASHFVREWTDGGHKSTRLATFTPSNYIRNRDEYVENYLPLLARIAAGLNALPELYTCAATHLKKKWTSADVEMAAYYWWARNGSK